MPCSVGGAALRMNSLFFFEVAGCHFGLLARIEHRLRVRAPQTKKKELVCLAP